MIVRNRNSGFTLIEVMITLTILAILVAVGVPSYRQYSQRANRADAKMALAQMAANQEKFYLQNNTYATTLAQLGMTSRSKNGHYELTLNSASAIGFQLQAKATGNQTKDSDCTIFAIDETGLRYGGPGPVGVGSNDPECWQGR